MKINLKKLVCILAVVPFAVAAIMFCFGTSEQSSPAKYKLGAVTWEEMTKITAGAGEGSGCYTNPTYECQQQSDGDYCEAYDNPNTPEYGCSYPFRVFSGNFVTNYKTKGMTDSVNTKNRRSDNSDVSCWTEYNSRHYAVEYDSDSSFDFYTFCMGGECEQGVFSQGNEQFDFCESCKHIGAGTLVSVQNHVCGDP
jgi:hypothetical protein